MTDISQLCVNSLKAGRQLLIVLGMLQRKGCEANLKQPSETPTSCSFAADTVFLPISNLLDISLCALETINFVHSMTDISQLCVNSLKAGRQLLIVLGMLQRKGCEANLKQPSETPTSCSFAAETVFIPISNLLNISLC